MDLFHKRLGYCLPETLHFADFLAHCIENRQHGCPDVKPAVCTIIGESGATISGGERQRLSIARAMLKDAPIIILDEATANVDPENEAELQEAVKALTAGKTLVMIAHRMKTVQEADQILVLDQGRIVQQGRHAELMQQGGIYADFVCSRRSAESWRIAERKSSEVKAEV